MEGLHGCIAFCLVVASWILIHRLSQRNKKGPKTWPLIGATIEQLKNYERMHDWLANYLATHKTIHVSMLFNSYTYIADPTNVEHILKTNFSNYPKDLLMRMTLDSKCKVGFGVEIGTLSPNFPCNSFAQAFDAANIIVTLRFIDSFWRIKRFLRIRSEALLEQSIKIIDEFTYGMIDKRKAEIEQARSTEKTYKEHMKHDLLSRFIELGEEPGSSFNNDKSLRDVVLNFVIAGRDTTATTLSWLTYMIMTHPSVAQKLYSELKQFEEERAKEDDIELISFDVNNVKSFTARTEQFARLLNYDSLGRLVYLHACITETLRLYPAVPQDPKGIIQDDILPDGTKLKAGDVVTYVPYSMGRMEYNWGPEAASFRPERWFKDGVFQNVSPFKFTAFQAGPHICLGKDSAYLQMKMTAAILCRFCKFELVPNHEPVKYRMMTLLSMAHGLNVHVFRLM